MAQSPLSEDGRGIAVGATAKFRREMDIAAPTEVARAQFRLFKRAERNLRDRICALGGDLLISHRMYDLLCDFSIDDAIHYLPADVLTWDGTKVDQYLYGYSTIQHDILNYQRAAYKTVRGVSGDPVVIDVSHWVASADRIPAYDLFCSAPVTRWIVSDRLRDTLIAHRMTGCRFEPVEVG